MLPLALILITAFYAVQTWRLTKHARAEVDEMVRQHREEREERRRLAFHAIRLELQQIRDACDCEGRAVKKSQPVRLPTNSWDTFCGEMTSLEQEARHAITSTYRHARLCNSAYERWANVPDPMTWPKTWVEQAAETHELASTALKVMGSLKPA